MLCISLQFISAKKRLLTISVQGLAVQPTTPFGKSRDIQHNLLLFSDALYGTTIHRKITFLEQEIYIINTDGMVDCIIKK